MVGCSTQLAIETLIGLFIVFLFVCIINVILHKNRMVKLWLRTEKEWFAYQ